jgi:hypothetical protein
MKPKTRAEAEKLVGKRTPLPGAGKPPGANWDKKATAPEPKPEKIRASDAFRSSGKGVPIATVKRMRKAGME